MIGRIVAGIAMTMLLSRPVPMSEPSNTLL